MAAMAEMLAAVVVNHNRQELLLQTLTSLQGQCRRVDQVFVVDNGSSDGSVLAVQTRTDWNIQVIALAENLGSAGGFRAGMDAAVATGASHVLLLDSDVTLAENCIAHLETALQQEPRCGVVGPKVYHWDSSTVLQELGGWIDWETADLRRSHWRHDESRHGAVTDGFSVDYVPACCLLARREAIEGAGNFDAGWFLYWDDIDWCERVRAAGWTIRIAPSARVQHFGGGANKRNLVPVYYGWRNRLIFFLRQTPPDRRPMTWRAFFEDYLLARFTCRNLGLTKLAAVMQLAIEDALAGVFGVKPFTGVDLSLDPPVPSASGAEGMVSVHHVIGSASADLAARPGLLLRDRFGKQLPADRAWLLRQAFAIERDRELPGLLSRAEKQARP